MLRLLTSRLTVRCLQLLLCSVVQVQRIEDGQAHS